MGPRGVGHPRLGAASVRLCPPGGTFPAVGAPPVVVTGSSRICD